MSCRSLTPRPLVRPRNLSRLTNPLIVTSEEESRYTSIIDAILETADLNTVTRKKIRMGLEKALGGKDLSDQKARFYHGSGPSPLPSLHTTQA